MEGIDNTSTEYKETRKDMNVAEEGSQNVGDYNNKASDKNIFVDCIHMNYDGDMEDQESVGSTMQDVQVKEDPDIHNGNERMLSLVWPDNVELYQPWENGQTLFSEIANCLYVQAFLRMCNLPYTLVEKTNAESIGSSGEVPVLRCGKFIVSGTQQIVKFVEAKGIFLTSGLKESQKIEISFYTSLVQMTLAPAEDFITWLDPGTFSKFTQSRFCSVHPWPLGSYLISQKRAKIQNKLDAMGWSCKTFEDVCDEMKMCLKALSEKIDGNYFFGNQPTQLDALVFAHVYAVLRGPLPKSQFSQIIFGYPKLVNHFYRVMDSFFSD